MKVTSHVAKPQFRPLTVEITFESEFDMRRALAAIRAVSRPDEYAPDVMMNCRAHMLPLLGRVAMILESHIPTKRGEQGEPGEKREEPGSV